MFRTSSRLLYKQRQFGLRFLHKEATGAEAYLEHREGGISILKLNRPAAKNALSMKLLKEFREAIDTVRFSK
jgi:methylglutaconyl-CoA hydratase